MSLSQPKKRKKVKGQTGTSYNFYNKIDSTWKQIYIDNFGRVLELKGTFQDTAMILKSERIKDQKSNFYYFNRITWTKDSIGNISQKWDVVDEKGTVLRVVFDGIYKRKTSSTEIENQKKVTGIGGIFIKCKDLDKLKHLTMGNLFTSWILKGIKLNCGNPSTLSTTKLLADEQNNDAGHSARCLKTFVI